MPKPTKKATKSHRASSSSSKDISSPLSSSSSSSSSKQPSSSNKNLFTSFVESSRKSSFWGALNRAFTFTRSGVLSLGTIAWYVVATTVVVVFPIRRAVEMDAMMEEERQREAQRFNPDTILPTGIYPSGISNVPITPRY